LEILAEGEPFAPELIGWLGSQNHSARAVMSAPVITVSEETNLPDIAEILTTHRIKRVLVVRDGCIVGMVSCADLVRALSVSLNTSVTEARA
jgi:CBS domain-containing protein